MSKKKEQKIQPIEDFRDKLKDELREIFKNYPIKVKNLSIGKPDITWQKALSEGLSYIAPLYLLYKSTKGSDKKVHIFNIPLLTPRQTFIIEGRERISLKILKPTDITEEKKKHLSPAEKSRDLRFYEVKEFNFYEYFLKYLVKVIRRVKENRELSEYLENPEYFGVGLDSYLRIFKYKTIRKIEMFPFLDTTNPLSEVEHLRKLSFTRGEKTRQGRDIHPTHYGCLCVVETPESEKIGMRLHLAHKAEIDPKTSKILTPLKNIKTKGVNKAASNTDDFIADSITELREEVLVRGGEDGVFVNASEVKYTDAYTDQLFGYAALQVVFIQHNDPARALMGAKNLKQAVPLKDPEVPIISTGYEKDVAELSGRLLKSKSKGNVVKVTREEMVIKTIDGKEDNYDLIKDVPSVASKTAFSQIPVVKEGQKVKKDQILAEGTGIKDGNLALGVNFLVAYMPYFGYNMDDGIVISQRVCEKLTSIHIKEYEIKKEDRDIPEWIAPEGLWLHKGTPLAKLKRKNKWKIEEINVVAKEEMIGGAVRKVFIEPEKILLWIRKEKHLQVGDKLMGRHGNKGIVAKVLPTNEMPYFEIKKEDKKERRYIDIVLNPHSVISRLNIGQIFETHLGWVAKEHPDKNIRQKAAIMGKPFSKVDMDELSKWLKESGLNSEGKIKLALQDGKKTANPVVVGYQYVVKLNHLASSKFSTRGEKGPVSFVTEMPLSGKKRGGQRIGEMEVWALIAHGAKEIVKEMLGEKANAHILNTGAVSISESLKVFVYYLRGLGMCLDFLDGEDNVIEAEDFDKESISKIEKYRIRWADESKMMSWGRHIHIPEKSQFEKLKEYLERKKEEIGIKNGAKNIINLGELDPEYKDEYSDDQKKGIKDQMGYIHLIEKAELCGRQIKVLPVIPIRCRPHPDSKINKLYMKIFLKNKKLEEFIRSGKEQKEDYSESVKSLQNYVKKLEEKLSKYIKGKRGIVRKAILGKRVNFSARAVIIPNPDIEANAAEIPKTIMAELNIKEGDKVLLNRQPSLHIHNIQAFSVLKNNYNAIAINPLVCGGFNADFDGDTMAIYKTDKKIPDSMNVSEQILLSANGKLNLNLTQDIVAGVYYASSNEKGRKELEELINDNEIYDAKDEKLINEAFLNNTVYKYFLKTNDRIATLRLAERIARFGLEWATLSGLTFSIFDLKELSITKNEKRFFGYENKSIEEAIKNKVDVNIKNPISVMILSGARGKLAQIRQMVGIKGVVDRIGGKKTTVRVDSCYLEGLSPTEYYLACYGARNSLGDKKLLTPQCGYLTRRLVFAASDVVISEDNCNTSNVINLELEKVLGRTLCEDITINDKVLLKKNTIVDEKVRAYLKEKGVESIKVRSPLTCVATKGMCSKCYGWDLSRRIEPQKGYAAGIIAAEVIGERATQDAMRTYHVGRATGTVTLFDKVKALFDNAVDPDTKDRASDRIKDVSDIMNLAHILYDYYERKVDIKHYEVILRALIDGNKYKGTKGVIIENRSILHKASFERTLEVLKESAEQEISYPINSVFEKLFI